MAPKQATAIVTKPQEAPAETGHGGLPQVIDYGQDAGAGGENISRDEFKIPLLRILMSNSPQCMDPAQGGIEGARQGMIFNTATQEIWDAASTPLLFIPAHRDHNYVEYIPREPYGGGFVGIRLPEDELILKLVKEQGKFGKLDNAEGTIIEVNNKNQQVPTEIVETYYLFGLLVTPDDQILNVVVPFTSTQIVKYQNFMTRYDSIRYPNSQGKRVLPPIWAHRYLLGTRPESNKKGAYHGWTLRLEKEPPIQSRMRLDDPLYQAAAGFYAMLKDGGITIDREAEQRAGSASADPPADEEIPF